MRKTNITKRLSLRAKFNGSTEVEVVIMDEFNNVQIELIPIRLGTREVAKTIEQMESGELRPENDENEATKGGSK